MSEFNHATPGPWNADGPYIVAETPDGPAPDIYLAEIVTKDDLGRYEADYAKRAANGRLMAAAPNLFEALSESIIALEYLRPEWFDEHEHEAEFDAQIARAKSALAKAGAL